MKYCVKYIGFSILIGAILGIVCTLLAKFFASENANTVDLVCFITCISFFVGIVLAVFKGMANNEEIDVNEYIQSESDYLLSLLNKIDAGVKLTEEETNCLSKNKCISLLDVKFLPQSIEYLYNVEKILIQCPHLSCLPETIGSLKKLKSFQMRKINITELPQSMTRLEKLEVLELESTNIKKLSDAIGPLKNLRYLNIQHTDIAELPCSIINCEKLKNLGIASTKIHRLPEKMEKLKSLKRLYVDSEQIFAIEEQLASLKNLEELYIIDTPKLREYFIRIRKDPHNIKALPESLGRLEKLKRLKVQRVKAYSLPESIGNLSNLEILDVSHSEIYTLPESIGELSKLKELLLNDTKIQYLPEGICNLQTLYRLNLSYMPLTTIPDDIGKLKELQWLDLSYLRLETLPGNVMLLGLKLDICHIPRSFFKKRSPEQLVGLVYIWALFGVPLRRDSSAGIYLWNTWVSHPPLKVLEKDWRSVVEYYASQAEDYASIDGSKWGKDNYEVIVKMQNFKNYNSQIGNQGEGAGERSTVIQIQNIGIEKIDWQRLSVELDQVKAFLKSQPESDENEILIGKITEAKKELSEGRNKKALEIIAQVGKTILSAAGKIGCSLLAELLKKILWL